MAGHGLHSALWLTVAFIHSVPGHVTLHVLGETNINADFARMIVVSNGTYKTHACFASAENHRQLQGSRSTTVFPFTIEPGESKSFLRPLDTNGPVTVTVFDEALVEKWKQPLLRALTALPGIRPPALQKLEVKAE